MAPTRSYSHLNSTITIFLDRATYRCPSPSCSSTKSARYVPYKDSHASKLRYELKRKAADVTIRSKSHSPSIYSARSCKPIPHSNINIQKGTISRPASPNVDCVKLYSTTTLILENVSPPNVSDATLGSAKLEWNGLRKASRSPSPLTRRSISCNKTPVGMKTRDTSPSRARSVSKTRMLCSENSIQPELKYNEFDPYKKKQTICRNENVPSYFTEKYSYNSQHSFKPQLEDIKSSFLILNGKNN